MPRLSFSGFDRSAEAKVKAVFEGLRLADWTLSDEAGADAVLIDLDSIYGQMAWLKGLEGGKVSIGLTSALRADTAYRLPVGFDSDALADLLHEVARGLGAAAGVSASAPTALAEPEKPARPNVEHRLAAHLAGRRDAFAIDVPGMPRLVIDPSSQQFAPGKSLKALLGYATAEVPAGAIHPVSAADAAAQLAQAGDPQPLSRLAWLLALGGGEGKVQGHGPGKRFGLGKWPQAEREFPKHFRIATVMLKAPGTVAEIAGASGASEAEVADYINAALAAGHATVA